MIGNSFSGNERNRLFLNREGIFSDDSLTSGIDFKQDGRGFAISDFDKDGFLDIGIVSNQAPRFRIAKLFQSADDRPSRVVKIRLVGGNLSNSETGRFSARDAIGAIVLAKTAQISRMFQISRGEGFSIQNSSTIHIGMGEFEQIDRLEIRWPSGKTTVMENIGTGAEIEVFERQN